MPRVEQRTSHAHHRQASPGDRIAFFQALRNLSPDGARLQRNPGAGTNRLPLVGPESQGEERAGRNTLRLIVAMSSGRLSLDRVGRHQSPSPFHRHEQHNTHSAESRLKGDIPTLHRMGTFLLCVDKGKAGP